MTIERFAGAKNVGSQPHVRSLMPAIGICWGYPTIKKPLQSTGRADYFGPVPNRAARCMASAAKGQARTPPLPPTAGGSLEGANDPLRPCHCCPLAVAGAG